MADPTQSIARLETLTDTLLMQVDQSEATSLRDAVGAPGSGLVISGDQAWKSATFLKDKGCTAPILVDRQAYKGKNRRPASAQFDLNWLHRQRELELPLIVPDAGYVAAGDVRGLRSLVRHAGDIENGLILLPLTDQWLYGTGLRTLLTALEGATAPVAIILEHQNDPMGVRRIFSGVLSLLRSGIKLLALRCDVSALGLLAHGAVAAAFGNTSSLRHLYPVKDGGGGFGQRREAALWPAGLALHHTDKIYDSVAAAPEDDRWRCTCRVCQGRRLDRLDHALPEEIRRHNIAALLDARRAIMAHPAGRARRNAWRNMCGTAVRHHLELSAGPVALNVPRALQHWADAEDHIG
ncbi:hypothetical protein [Actinomadura sp. WAC 06369]|uniref:hypothetical protein n=1 Tax=Actinomadura sp. WAC 06369 TaxID=2203193 RepID=UPI000F7983BB|nr:hypothetical protein [Actinomadura sp. WAC 06369]